MEVHSYCTERLGHEKCVGSKFLGGKGMSKKISKNVVLLAATAILWQGCKTTEPTSLSKSEESHRLATGIEAVYFKDDGKLGYQQDEKGNQIPDYSYVGYQGGGVKLPEVSVVKTLYPSGGDDSALIQRAIDEVASWPLEKRGAILLKKGKYYVDGSITINRSGIVLRGEGAFEGGTTLIATGTTVRDLIVVSGQGERQEIPGTRKSVKESYVPVGSHRLHLGENHGFAPKDLVVVYRPSTQNWIEDLHMDQLGGEGVRPWRAGEYDLHFERKVIAVDDEGITIDAPLVQALDQRYGGGAVYKYRFPGRISEVGIEHLRLQSEYQKGKEEEDEQHARSGIFMDKVAHGFVRNIEAHHFWYAAVHLGEDAKYITVEDSASMNPVSKIVGGRRYSFVVYGSLNLLQRLKTDHGRHDFVTQARVRGPNVFLDSEASNAHSDIGPHHRWTVGSLYDNVKGDQINLQDRGGSGTGHGWTGGSHVFWNCEANSMVCQNPPTSQNYSIGFIGRKSSGYNKDRNDCHWLSYGEHVPLRSLYLKQLEDRLGREAVLNITAPWQR